MIPKNILENYIIFSENEPKTLKLFSYGIGSISLAVAIYVTKPFAKFRKPSSIPSRLLHKKLQGTVRRVEPNYGTLLLVDHKPLIPLPRLSSPKYLPVKIAGVNITANGISWLQTIVNGKKITFIPLAKERNYVTCMVSMQYNEEHLEIGKELTNLGFAMTMEDSLKTVTKSKDILNYQKCLLNAQKWAQRKRNGNWHFIKKPTLLWRIQQNLSEKLKSILPTFITKKINI